MLALEKQRGAVRPNTSVEARPNGKPACPPPGCAYHPSGGQAASPSAPPHLERWTSMDGTLGSIEMKKITLLAFVAAILCGCSQEQQQLTFEMPSDINPQIKQVVEVAWPKMLAACPGFNRYASDMSFAGIEDNLAYAPDDAKRIEVKFKVTESPVRIPVSYRAFGHTCYFGVTPDGKKLTISKSPCASICANSEISTTGNYEKPL